MMGYFDYPEPALEPPDSWPFSSMPEPYEEEYDRGEDELSGIFNRR